MSVKELFDLSGRVALITGGSRGLGLAMAHALGEMGAKLAITARKEAEVQSALEELRAAGYAVFGAMSDLSRPETLEPMIAAAEAAHGPIDILINNAGATWGAPAESHPLDAWKKVIDVNLTGTFLVSQKVGARCMIPRRRGRIVNIASVAGLKGSSELRALAYHTSKGGVVNFTRALAAEWGRHGITVNAICPGFIPSKMSRDVLAQIGPQVIAATPLRQLGEDRDLAGVAVLLCSDAARHITGQIIAVDGGLTAV
ncbi:MAG TPA: SDR family oxidoreductase [Steroidobacteraceae bacterium]|nr:SDR family oxidoreductase [Steroidobacteraceae bacterium]